jgi:hypothetical protein
MKRLTLFAKGNLDVFDSLHSCRIGGQVVWNGVNEVLRERHPGLMARLRHETSTATRGLINPPAIDGPLADRPELLAPYPLGLQASREIFTTDADAIILSILPDVAMRHHRHRLTGEHLHISDLANWNVNDLKWLEDHYEFTQLAPLEEVFENHLKIVEQIRVNSEKPILIYNMSPMTPGPITHCFLGLEDSYATRVRRFNLMLVELSERTGVSIVDVDGVVAKAGSDRVKLDMSHLTAEGSQLVAEEVVRILEDLGAFDD